MLCPACRRQVERGAASCPSCGAPRRGVGEAFELVLADRTRVPIVGELTIGRAPGNAVQLADPSVSRVHARVAPGQNGGAPVLRDAGSSHGTWVDGRRLDGALVLYDGARIALGDQELVVERSRGQAEAGRTLLVPAGASLVVPRAGDPRTAASTQARFGARPRLRSGYALKRLEAAEGTRRWVLKDLVGGRLVRLAEPDARLLELLDGQNSISDLTREAERLLGPGGAARLARLLADLGARGLLAGASASAPGAPEASGLARLLRPRVRTWRGAGDLFERTYLRGGWLLFTRPALAAIAATATAGLTAFAYVLAARYGTPFVVASHVGLGGLVFLAGRFAVAAAHETAHALTMASFGRRVGQAGVKLVLVFPYVFVDTSDAWFEPRRRRIAISAAGPVSDLALGGAFALCCLAAPAGAVRDILFQLAFGAYLGALLNLNPLLERDGYQILVDVLREPGLRRRALEQLRRRLGGQSGDSDSRLLGRYGAFAIGWTVVAAGLAVAMSVRYEPVLATVVPGEVAWALLAAIWASLLVAPFAIVLPPLRERRRAGRP